MIKYKVSKCRHGRCMCHINGTPWRVTVMRGLERRTVSLWPGQSGALDAALELAGLAKPLEPTC